MEQADRSQFERDWQHAFEDARISTPDRVWNGIEKSLDRPSWGRKRIFLIQIAMAASVLFAMSIGAAGIYQMFTDQTGIPQVARENQTNNEVTGPGIAQQNPSQNGQSEPGIVLEDVPENEDVANGHNAFNSPSASPTIRSFPAYQTQTRVPQVADRLVEGSVASSFSGGLDPLDSYGSQLVYEAQPYAVIPTGVPYLVSPVRKQKGPSWAALGVSTGHFSNSSGSGQMYALAPVMDNANGLQGGQIIEETSGSVFQLEVNLGTHIAQRWVIQGGLGYMERNSGGSSNLISARGNAVADLSSESFSQTVIEAPYQLENSLQMITVPVQVGYVLMDNKVGIRLLTGVANEIMLRHRVEDSEGKLNARSYSPDDSDTYNAFGLSALLTTEVNYTIAKHYQVAVRPQVRQSLISVRDTDDDLTRSLELGFSVRYQFE